MSKDQQSDGGGIWNVRSLVGDLADELPQTPAAPPAQAPPRTAPETAGPPPAQPTIGPARRMARVEADGPEEAAAPVAVSGEGQHEAGPSEPRVRGGWISPAEALPQTSGNSMRMATLLVGIAVLALLAVLVGVGVASSDGDDQSASSSSGSIPEPPAELSDDGDATGQSGTESSTPATEASDREEQALSQLQEMNRQDLPVVALDGRYAAQLASKTVGIVDPHQTAANGSHTFYASDILAEHTGLREKFNAEIRVVLLLSTDYGRQQLYEGQPLWVTFALLPNSSKESVAAWCAEQFPDFSGSALENQCVPRRLNPPGTSAG
ncbi:hypothetical protein [Micromonospora chersina]|uniref:hypothetical protein n=1 Tax=Micromonospora chersina TaxID=47854 RepID=UPI0033A1F0E7